MPKTAIIAEIASAGGGNHADLTEVVRRTGVMPYAIDRESADRLRTLSEKLVFG